MSQPSISISITVYNLEKYVEKCLRSIIEQDFIDFECIIIDDGSTDKSGEICKNFAKLDERITYFYQSNQGVSAARNRAIEASTGKYVLLADGDDHLHPSMLGRLFDLCEANNADVSTCLMQKSDKKIDEVRQTKDRPNVEILDNESALFQLFNGKLTGFGLCNKLYRRELFKDVRFPIGRSFEDAAIQYKLLYQANKIIFTDEKLYYYVIHEESLTRKKLTRYSSKRLDIIENFKEAMTYFEQNPVSKQVIDVMVADYYKSLRWLVIDIMKEDKTLHKEPLQTVTNQINLWKNHFLQNELLSRKEMIFIHLWSHVPRLTMKMYQFRNRYVIQG